MEPITNPPPPTRAFPDDDPAWQPGAPMPRTVLPCGCHIRRPDYEAILCAEHLADLNEGTG